jgi:hypothetical protein
MEAVLPTSAQMALGIAHEGALVWDLKWRPPGPWRDSKGHRAEAQSIGQLAAALGDGSVHV